MKSAAQTKKFGGLTKEAATAAALKWQSDFSQHGPLTVDSVVAVQRGSKFVATITYRE